MSESGIYRIRNVVSGRMYVGSAMNMTRREREHWKQLRGGYHHCKFLQRAWKKYGAEAFVFEVVELVPDHSKLIEREQVHIDALSTEKEDRGYNVCRVAGSPRGTRRTIEQIEHHRRMITGRKHTPESRANMSAAQRGKKMPPEAIEKRRATILARGGFKHSPETIARIAESKKGSTHTEEWKRNHSAMMKGRKLSEDHVEALREAHRSLTKEQVAEIVERRLAGESYISLAKAFNSTKDTVRNWCMREGLPKKNIYTTPEQRAEMIRLRAEGWMIEDIAKAVGVCEVTAWWYSKPGKPDADSQPNPAQKAISPESAEPIMISEPVQIAVLTEQTPVMRKSKPKVRHEQLSLLFG